MRLKLIFAAAAMTLAATQLQAQTKWDLPAGYPATNFHSRNLQLFADDVKKLSGGKLDITVHPGASLFKVPEIKRAVQTGQVQAGELLMSNVENEIPVFGIDTVPFLATSYDDAMKLYKASKPVIEKKLEAQGMTLLYTVPWPPQGIYANKTLNAIGDMKGLKFRSYNPTTARIAELIGAQPVTIQAAELAQALATNTVNSFITSASTGRDSKVWESLKYFYDAQIWLPKDMVFVSTDAFKKLDAATQKALLDASAAAETRGWDMSKAEAEDAKAALVKGGMTVAAPPPQLAADFKKLGETLSAEWLKKAGADGEAAVAAYKKM
ncbi:TRAP transporter substrate-binding protein [Ferrovibrio xuzhouensis]|uniref:TRAP transporter substrate-binding protein n=1 Tax=Ferrovibrio xuzhouensis TaxID=1576914 RepID=A0ABV7VKT6_9PROT